MNAFFFFSNCGLKIWMFSEKLCSWIQCVLWHLRYWTHPQSMTLSPTWSDLSSPQEWLLNDRLLAPGTQRATMFTQVMTGRSVIWNGHLNKHCKINWKDYVSRHFNQYVKPGSDQWQVDSCTSAWEIIFFTAVSYKIYIMQNMKSFISHAHIPEPSDSPDSFPICFPYTSKQSSKPKLYIYMWWWWCWNQRQQTISDGDRMRFAERSG